jgi:multiple sugar transport system substrate-binding protein
MGIAPFPIGLKGRHTFIGGSNLAVSTHCRHPEQAWELVKFLSTRESQKRHCLAISALPARMDSLEDVFAGHDAARSVFVGSLDFARPLHSVVAMGSIERALWDFGERVLKLILNSGFHARSLRNEIEVTDREINTILSFYGHAEGQRVL